ncbi:MAG: cyclase family protein [Alphaproteobacteria bacterium]|nr:cyclase family protein [Alphaproteobacteria bacterium]
MSGHTTKPVVATIVFAMAACAGASAQVTVGTSPWGPEDELGKLNLITPQSRAAILSRASAERVYDLSVEYYVGMPSWQAAGDPQYQLWMTHTPRGTKIDDPMHVGDDLNGHVSYTGSAFSMYSRTGTHIDALNHFGIAGRLYNGFAADEHLGDRGWTRTGAETIPPIVARGVLLDVAAARGVDMLRDNHRILRADLEDALRRQKVSLQQGDVVLIRTGRMQVYADTARYIANPPGLGLDAARFLVEESGAMILGADNLSFEAFPSEVEGNYVPLHTYLLAEHGVPIMELVYLEDLARDEVFEFAFIGASLKLRGADAAPMRPIALPVR